MSYVGEDNIERELNHKEMCEMIIYEHYQIWGDNGLEDLIKKINTKVKKVLDKNVVEGTFTLEEKLEKLFTYDELVYYGV